MRYVLAFKYFQAKQHTLQKRESTPKKWVLKDEYGEGEIKYIIMDPHIKRGISPKDCKLCKVIYQRDPSLSNDRERNKELEEKTQDLTDVGAASDALPFDEDVNVDKME